MATDRQIAANRRNGSLGRGPKTSAGKARSSRNALKHGLSIPVNRDKTLRRQIAVLARILAQSEAGNIFGQARAVAEAELELARARAVLEAVLTRAGITAEWNGGPEQGTALIHVQSPIPAVFGMRPVATRMSLPSMRCSLEGVRTVSVTLSPDRPST